VRQHVAHRARGFTKKRYQGLDRAPTFAAMTTTFSYGYDYRAQHVSLTTLDGRLVLPYQGYTPHIAYIQAGRHVAQEQKACRRQPSPPTKEQDLADQERPLDQARLAPLAWPWEEKRTEPTEEELPPVSLGGDLPHGVTFGAAKLWRDPRTKQWYLVVTRSLPLPAVREPDLRCVKGIDLGTRYLAVSTTADHQTPFLAGRAAVHQGEAFQRVRKRLRHKGTRSATARWRQFALRERRFKASTKHQVANRLVAPATLLGLEDLTHIRERTKRAGKRQRRKYAKWAFAEVGAFIAYKAALAGSVVVKVDADYTSQQCPTCGYRAKKNRLRNGLRFRCTNPEGCRCDLHADLVGARQGC